MRKLTPLMQPKEEMHGFAYLLIQLFGIPLLVLTINEFLPDPLSIAWQNFLCFFINFLCVIIIFRIFLINSLKQLPNSQSGLFLHIALYLFLYYAGTVLVNILIYRIAPGFSNANDTNIATMTKDQFLLMAIGTVLFVPPVEEILYRGVLFGYLYKRSSVLAYVVSIIVFALIHVIGYLGTNPPIYLALSFLQYIPAGYCLARVYEKSNSIFAPIIMHAIINLIGINSI